jgi:hypothetical protein
VAALVEELDAAEIPSAGVGRFFVEARAYLRARAQLLLHLGGEEGWQEQIYPLPPLRVINLARRVVCPATREKVAPQRPFEVKHQVRLMEDRLRQYGLTDWKVVASPRLSAANTDSANRVINIRSEITYSMAEMKRNTVHEVDTHVLRAANGYGQPFRIFAVGAVPSYLMTEEGLAVLNEERMGYTDQRRNRTFAGRVLAARRAVDSAFADVYCELRDFGFSHEEAFTTTKRVKRGLGDTRAPGGFIKDQAYFVGRLLVEEFVLTGGDLTRLYAGKISIEHLPFVRELGLRPPRYIPLPYA